jgi:hypothetical protein
MRHYQGLSRPGNPQHRVCGVLRRGLWRSVPKKIRTGPLQPVDEMGQPARAYTAARGCAVLDGGWRVRLPGLHEHD